MYDDECWPVVDPFDMACQEAARRLADGEPMTETDWEALSLRSAAELREYDFSNTF